VKRTPRGFAIYGEYKTSRGSVRIQKSSSAAGPHVWIFSYDRDGNDAVIHLGKASACSPHLTPTQARRVANALLKFANTHRAAQGKGE
jgi:hypothetical protein